MKSLDSALAESYGADNHLSPFYLSPSWWALLVWGAAIVGFSFRHIGPHTGWGDASVVAGLSIYTLYRRTVVMLTREQPPYVLKKLRRMGYCVSVLCGLFCLPS